MGQSGDGVTNQLHVSADAIWPHYTPSHLQQLLAWPGPVAGGCLMIDNLLNIQILVFAPPPPLVCVWGGGGGGAVWPGLMYLRCCCCLHSITSQASTASRAKCGPSIHYLHICCWGSCVLAGPMESWLGIPDTAYKCIIIQEKNS